MRDDYYRYFLSFFVHFVQFGISNCALMIEFYCTLHVGFISSYLSYILTATKQNEDERKNQPTNYNWPLFRLVCAQENLLSIVYSLLLAIFCRTKEKITNFNRSFSHVLCVLVIVYVETQWYSICVKGCKYTYICNTVTGGPPVVEKDARP